VCTSFPSPRLVLMNNQSIDSNSIIDFLTCDFWGGCLDRVGRGEEEEEEEEEEDADADAEAEEEPNGNWSRDLLIPASSASSSLRS
jgi:CO dehydrogenase/acetyl-CoA synthase beta subunit